MAQLELNKKYVDYLHNQKQKGAKMPLNKKKIIQKENLNNPEDKMSMDVKDFEEFKKFRQEKMNLESSHVILPKPYKLPFKQVNDFENKPF